MEYCTSSSRKFTGRVLNLRVDEVRIDNEKLTSREVVEHHGAVAIVPLLENRRVILVRQYRYAVQEELLEIPAGTLEPNEEPERCATRELQEETGYQCGELEKILECYVAPGYSTEKIHFYVAKNLVPSGQKPEEDERIKAEVISLSEGLAKIRNGEIRDAKTVCGLYRANELV